ncbi:MAG TPA: hypothetical protein VGU61_11185 [Noviherbaspirillum sp.]|jgi:hypothetical protein|uniref:hypothetical protein n=1 Tax=Noviherbaspirillum sp. TaxID=1926288 RepID=UPI002DDCFCEA|nr:hypothetical protein [Noviherbaspirillum sp.]HEV2610821.1 hypothetical protein [Noviherbaspirillum sp.]
MKSWTQALRDGAISGSAGSALSTVMLSACGEQEADAPLAPTNAISHWVWGDRALAHEEASIRHTLLGYAIHHGASTLWAVVYEKWFGEHAENKALTPAVAGGFAVAALACFVDYQLTPRRLRPGYEHHLSKRSLFLVYASLGIALPIRGYLAADQDK